MTIFTPPVPYNEPILGYMPNSSELKSLHDEINRMKSTTIDIPLRIGKEKIFTDTKGQCIIPHDKSHVLGTFSQAGKEELEMAIAASKEAKEVWESMPWSERASVFLKMADLLAGPFRAKLNAATMLGQSKNLFQAEIDSACELIDFYRFNVTYMHQIYNEQPNSSTGVWNRMEYRPLEGFVFAVTPFNFTSIAGNLPTSPAMMGNTVLWKPASSAVYSAHYLMDLFEAAGLPPGVINFVPGKGSVVGSHVLPHPDLAGVHFTGSTEVFQHMWETIGKNIKTYKSYPRIVGETGGKDFIFAHPSADTRELVTAMIRGAFEYSGQKCSAASRAYIPRSKWEDVKSELLKDLATVKMGDPTDIKVTVNAVIDHAAFQSISQFIAYTEESPDAEILYGGKVDDSKGFFIEPTLILAHKSDYRTMCEEIFGPVLTLYLYDDDKYEETLDLCNSTSNYALTGSIFAHDRLAINTAMNKLRHSAGNFYINDKPTGAVVGQQPFGGARASGTNDKAGSFLNLIRWTSARAIKENFIPPTHYEYPYMR